MQQIRIVDEATRIPDTENMRLMLSDCPDQTWIARLRQLIAATASAAALNAHIEGSTLVFACPDRAELVACRRLIGQLVDQTNGMPKTHKKECPRLDCPSPTAVHYVSPGTDAGHSGPLDNPLAEIWECDGCRRAFLLGP
jgi:hypothetical protein